MIGVMKMKVEHLMQLAVHNGDEFLGVTQKDFEVLSRCDHQFTFTSARGEILMCAGLAMYWEGRGEAWARVNHSQTFGKNLLPLQRFVLQLLDSCPVRRIEASVEENFTAGHRWVRSLGFKLEAPVMRGFSPSGKNCSLYARVK